MAGFSKGGFCGWWGVGISSHTSGEVGKDPQWGSQKDASAGWGDHMSYSLNSLKRDIYRGLYRGDRAY